MVYKNATGHVIGFNGVVYQELEWLSLKLNFRHSFHNLNTIAISFYGEHFTFKRCILVLQWRCRKTIVLVFYLMELGVELGGNFKEG